MGKTLETIGALVKRYSIVVIFPSVAGGLIYADLRHTALWKKSLAEQNQQSLASNS